MTVTKIKAIETSYRGYRFRSRTEARWAVYFDEVGIKFEYELEGFEFDGERYLPDFWLPEAKMWAEVKPIEFSETELRKCSWLASGTDCPCLQLVGAPWCKPYYAVEPCGQELPYAICKVNGKVCPCIGDEYGQYDNREGDRFPFEFPDTIRPMMEARSARFEFGGKHDNN